MFLKPAFGTAGSEARATGEGSSVKYSLILLSALLVVACGGLTKVQQGDAYLRAAGKVNAVWKNAGAERQLSVDNSYTESTDLESITNYYSTGSAADLAFIKDLQVIEWSDDYSDTASRLISCMNELYVIERDAILATDLQTAIDQEKKADEKKQNCRRKRTRQSTPSQNTSTRATWNAPEAARSTYNNISSKLHHNPSPSNFSTQTHSLLNSAAPSRVKYLP